MIDVIVDGGESVAKDLWDLWGSKTPEAERREAIEEIAKATPEQLRLTVEELVPEIAPEYPESEPALKALLPQIQANIRRTLRRPDDPTGTSTAGWQKFDSAQALLPLIPTKLARFMAGQRPLAGIDLELVELLGIGGFGEVWRAQNQYMPSASPVALKFCLDAAAAKSLKNEAALLDRIVQQGRHPGIVELQQSYLSATIPALQYEYIAGGDLADLIKYWYSQPTPPSVDVILASLLELAQTMAFAHAAGIVHRDLKPANILIPVSAAIARLPKFGSLTRSHYLIVPPYTALAPRISSIRSNWLYLAMRSERLAEPVLIWPVPRATARSAIVVSSVSPERWLITAV